MKRVTIEEHVFRDNLVGWYNMSREKFARVFYGSHITSSDHYDYIDGKYQQFKENPLVHVLTLDSSNFKRFVDFILDEEGWG